MVKRAEASSSTLPGSGPTRWSRPPVAIATIALLVVCGGLAAWSNSFRAPFVFDDLASIVENPTIRRWWRLSDVLSPPFNDGQTVGGRPLLNASFALNYALSATRVWSYHAVNLAIHVGAALLLFGIVRRTLSQIDCGPSLRAASAPLAGAVALLWLLHPLQTAAVTYIVQRAESLAGLFLLLTLYAFVRAVARKTLATDVSPRPASPVPARRHRFRPEPYWLALSFTACLAGMATKEVMAAAPLLVLLYDRTFVAGSWRDAWRSRWRFHLSLGASWMLLAGLIAGTDHRGGSAGFGAVTSRWHYLLTQCEAITRYLRLAAWPDDLTFDYGMDVASGLGDVWPQAVLVVAFLALSVWAIGRNHPLGFLAAWFLVILAPTSSIVPVTSQTMAEHRMYLPLAALVVAAVVVLHRVLGRASFAIGVVLAAALGTRTFDRNDDYRTPVALWSDTVAKRPDNARAHTNLGSALAQAGRSDDAMRSFRKALQVYPNHASAHYNLGVALAAADRHDEALGHLTAAVRLEPGFTAARVNLGNALVRSGRPADAIAHYQEVLRLEPGSVDAELNLALALIAIGRHADAIAPLRRAIAALPAQTEARFALGNALVHTGDFPAAIAAYTAVLAISPEHVVARNNLANALLVVGRTDEAIAEYERVLRLRPGDPAVGANLEEALARQRAARP